MKTEGSPLHGSYFELASAKHPDLQAPVAKKRRVKRPRRRRRFAPLLVVLSGALAGVAWLAIALRPVENVELAVAVPNETPVQPVVETPVAESPATEKLAAKGSAAEVPVIKVPAAVPVRPLEQAPIAEAPTAEARIAEAPAVAASAAEAPFVELPPTLAVSDPGGAEASQSNGLQSRESASEGASLVPARPQPTPTQPAEVPTLAAELERAGEADEPKPTDVVASMPAAVPASLPAQPVLDDSVGSPAPPDTQEAAPQVAELVRARKISSPAPHYPEESQQAGEEGVVVVEAAIDETGRVTGTTVVSEVSPALDQAAEDALSTWRFEPATRGGVPVASSYRVGIRFALTDAEEPPAGPVEVGGEVQPPRRLSSPLPSYPDAAWAAGVTGDVLVRALIDVSGSVTEVEVLRGLPYGMTEAAVEAIRKWKFEPATRGGEPVAVYRNLSVRFET